MVVTCQSDIEHEHQVPLFRCGYSVPCVQEPRRNSFDTIYKILIIPALTFSEIKPSFADCVSVLESLGLSARETGILEINAKNTQTSIHQSRYALT